MRRCNIQEETECGLGIQPYLRYLTTLPFSSTLSPRQLLLPFFSVVYLHQNNQNQNQNQTFGRSSCPLEFSGHEDQLYITHHLHRVIISSHHGEYVLTLLYRIVFTRTNSSQPPTVSCPYVRLPSSFSRALAWISIRLPPLNFITLHYAYFIGVCLFSSVIFWGSSTPPRSISYIDSLFLVVSAMTEAGLNTVNLSQMNTFQQFILFLLILLGSAIWVSIAVVHVRRKAFERRFKNIVEEERQRRRSRNISRRGLSLPLSHSRSRPEVDGVVVRGRAITSENNFKEAGDANLTHSYNQTPPDDNSSIITRRLPKLQSDANEIEADNSNLDPTIVGQSDTGPSRRITFTSPASPTRERRILSMQGVGARQNIGNHPISSPRPIYFDEVPKTDEENTGGLSLPRHGILSGGFIGRNSQFSNLSLAEREEIGGVEYRAVTYLAVIVPLYFVAWQLLGCIGLGAYVASKRASTTEVNAENPWYVRNVLRSVGYQIANSLEGGSALSMGFLLSITAE